MSDYDDSPVSSSASSPRPGAPRAGGLERVQAGDDDGAALAAADGPARARTSPTRRTTTTGSRRPTSPGDWTLDDLSERLELARPRGLPPLGVRERRARPRAAAGAARRSAKRSAASTGPVRFVVSTREDIERFLAVQPTLEFKVDPTSEWSRELIDELAATGRIRVTDLKGYYRGTAVDQPADPRLYRDVVEGFPDAVIEDAAFTDETRPILEAAADRLSFDAPIHSVEDVQALEVEPRWLNIKPSRFGTCAGCSTRSRTPRSAASRSTAAASSSSASGARTSRRSRACTTPTPRTTLRRASTTNRSCRTTRPPARSLRRASRRGLAFEPDLGAQPGAPPYPRSMAACRQCGSELPEGARFCPACGTAVDGRRGEERKVVTVLFADLVDSTGRGDGRDPEDVRAAVRPHLARMRAELEHYGGTFEKYVGDAVMAVFGAPVAHEDDPERAVRAALAIRDSTPGVRVGVNTGEAVVQLGAAPGRVRGLRPATSSRRRSASRRRPTSTPCSSASRRIGRRREQSSTASAGCSRRAARRARRRLRGVPGDHRAARVARGPAARSAGRPQGGAQPDPRHARPRAARPNRSARHADRRSGDRQEPARLGAPARARGRARARHLAPRSLPSRTATA